MDSGFIFTVSFSYYLQIVNLLCGQDLLPILSVLSYSLSRMTEKKWGRLMPQMCVCNPSDANAQPLDVLNFLQIP